MYGKRVFRVFTRGLYKLSTHVSHLAVNFTIRGSRHGSGLFLKGVLARKAQ